MDETETGFHILNLLSANLALIFTQALPIITGIVITLILLILSGLISGSEIAYFSITPKIIKELKKSESQTDKHILKHLENPKRLLAILLISNNFVNITIVLVSAWLTPLVFDFSNSPLLGFIIQVVVITTALLLFGEILPKIYARQKVRMFSRLMARPLQILSQIFYPLVFLLERSTRFIDKQLQNRKNTITMSELSEVVEIAHAQATDVETEEVKILKGIATYGETEVREIMKARVDVSAADIRMNLTELVDFVKEWGFSRYPVFGETSDDVKGVLHIKDLLPHLSKSEFKWQSLVREPIFIPENKKINDLLQDFKAKKNHLAIVVDEYGGTSGIVTLEDVIEEILGEISDEFDTKDTENNIVKLGDKIWSMDAKTSINDFCKLAEFELDFFDEVKGESDSVAGLLLEILGDFPKENQKIGYKNIEFQVMALDKKRIKKVKVSIL